MKISEDLVNACRANNRAAQKQLYVLLLPYLRAVCLRYLHQSNMVKDILQEVFILIFKKIDQFDPNKGPFLKWAVRITINTTLNFNNRNKEKNIIEFRPVIHDIPQTPQAFYDMSDEVLLRLLRGMPKQYYEVFNLFVIDAYSHEEIATALEISVALSRKRLSRGREWLKNTFQNQSQEHLRDEQNFL